MHVAVFEVARSISSTERRRQVQPLEVAFIRLEMMSSRCGARAAIPPWLCSLAPWRGLEDLSLRRLLVSVVNAMHASSCDFLRIIPLRVYSRRMMRKTSIRVMAIAGVVVLTAAAALAQFGGPRGRFALRRNIGYDGRFTFVRLNYTTAPGGYWYRGEPAWAHGYPLAEQNLMSIMNEVSLPRRARRGDQFADARRSRVVQVSDRLRHRAGLVGDDRR